MNLLYLEISHSGVHHVSPLRHLFHKVVDQWRTRLRACVKAEDLHRFEHLLYTSADLRRDLTGSFQSHSPISEEDNIQNRSFLWLMFSQVV